MGVSSTKLDRQQQNFSGHILLSWSVVLQGRPARQNGGDPKSNPNPNPNFHSRLIR